MWTILTFFQHISLNIITELFHKFVNKNKTNNNSAVTIINNNVINKFIISNYWEKIVYTEPSIELSWIIATSTRITVTLFTRSTAILSLLSQVQMANRKFVGTEEVFTIY